MLAQFFFNEEKKWPAFIDSVEDFPHLRIVRLRGNLDAKSMGDIQSFMKKAKKKAGLFNKSVILDLRKVEHVDTAGVAHLLKVFNDLKQKKYRLGIMNVPENLRNMIGILKLDDIFLTFDSEKKALKEILAWSQDWK